MVCVQRRTHTLKGLLLEGMVWDSAYSFPLFIGLGGLEQRHELDKKKERKKGMKLEDTVMMIKNSCEWCVELLRVGSVNDSSWWGWLICSYANDTVDLPSVTIFGSKREGKKRKTRNMLSAVLYPIKSISLPKVFMVKLIIKMKIFHQKKQLDILVLLYHSKLLTPSILFFFFF